MEEVDLKLTNVVELAQLFPWYRATLFQGIEINESKGKGRGIFAAQNIAKDTIILKETPLIFSATDSSVCSHCFRSKLTVFTCCSIGR
jgi:hypothetical protein